MSMVRKTAPWWIIYSILNGEGNGNNIFMNCEWNEFEVVSQFSVFHEPKSLEEIS